MKHPARSLSRAQQPPVRPGSARAPERSLEGERDPLHQTLHFLSNNIHSLSLRLFVAASADPDPALRPHLEAAQRLATESLTLLERVHALLPPAPAPPRAVPAGHPRVPTSRRRPVPG